MLSERADDHTRKRGTLQEPGHRTSTPTVVGDPMIKTSRALVLIRALAWGTEL